MPPEPVIEAEVAGLGSEGDGILRIGGDSLFVPYVIAGERVRVIRRQGRSAELQSVLRPSPDRVTPPCGLFGRCGGCMLQHVGADAVMAFKQGQVREALTQAGFALPDEIGFSVSPPGARRRMDLALRRTAAGMLVGLHRRAGAVVDLRECHVLEPSLFALIGALRPVLLRLHCLRAAGSVIVNLLDSGPDLLLATDGAPDAADRGRLAKFAGTMAVPRIAWRPLKEEAAVPETICALAPVHHTLSGARITPPPGAFLQATATGEVAITASVLAGLPASMSPRARIIELYAGCGTLSWALAGRFKVLAFEGHKEAAACLRTAAALGLRLEARQRDLVRQPLLASEFAGCGAVVLDPPFAGAGPQMAEIARADVERVILVSCNPRALGRDAALLYQAGYGLERLSVIDQFTWSAAVESVAVFTRSRRRKARTRTA